MITYRCTGETNVEESGLILLYLCAYVEKAQRTSGHHFVWMKGRQTRSMRITRKIQSAEINYVMSCNLNFLFSFFFLSFFSFLSFFFSKHLLRNKWEFTDNSRHVAWISPPALKWSVCRTNTRKYFDSFIMKNTFRYFRLPKTLPISC